MNTPSHPPLRILVADDHPIFRIGLRAVLQQDPDLAVVGEASSPSELTQWLEEGQCDLLITDFMMPAEHQNDGLRLLETVRRHWPELPILVVTMLNNAGLFRSMLGLGVKGLLGKASLVSELPIAIAQVRRNKVFIADSVSQALLQEGEVRPDRMFEREALSPREIEVTRLLAGGLSVGEIAAQLNRSKQTVSAQKVSAMRKLGVANDAALFIYLQEHGLA
ncbi:response regulator transcription factor [Pseudomonas sp. App30]|uniref:response regulator n=1 Tax=Pseudomonas sp. App30 TaxID=3068990 RepID=UPI003A8109E1